MNQPLQQFILFAVAPLFVGTESQPTESRHLCVRTTT